MPEFFLDVYPVGYDRLFVAGRIPGNEDFEVELHSQQIAMYHAFVNEQREQLDVFLMGLVT